MAMHDWNGNGDRNDMADNFIEYQIYKDVTGQEEKTSYTSGGNGISTFGVIISVIAGLVLQSALYVALDVDVGDVPVLIIIILWGFFSTIAAVIAEKIGL